MRVMFYSLQVLRPEIAEAILGVPAKTQNRSHDRSHESESEAFIPIQSFPAALT
jgi:hypothetical protein